MRPMKHLALFTVMILSTVAGVRGTASAQLLTASRCQNAFGVPLDTAQRRYAWALFCRSHPGPDATGALRPGTAYLTDQSVTDHDTTTTDINAAVSQQRLFPTYFDYVTFGVFDIPDSALATGANPTTPPTVGSTCLALPTSAVNVGLCVAGCYVEGTQLQFADGNMGIKDAATAGKVDLVTLAPTATLDNLQYTKNTVEHYITDVVESVQQIYTISMMSGGQLRVTNEHPLLTSDGVIHQAQGLKVGDQLIRANGKLDPIVSIQTDKVLGKVYNVKPVTTDYVSNIVVAGGYLNGSIRYQNEFLDTINSLILRRSLSEQLDKLGASAN